MRSAIQPLGWIQLPGTMTFVAASPDGSLWGLSPDTTGTGDRYIYHYVNGAWAYASGAANRLAVGPDGTAWAVTAPGGIYSFQNGAWNAVAGGATDITVGVDGLPYVISNQNPNQYGYAIWRYTGVGWTQLPGAGVRIAASWDPGTYPGGIVPGGFYLLNALGTIYYYNSAAGGYSQLSGTATEIAPTKNGGIFTLSYPADTANGNAISYEDLQTGVSSAQPGAAFMISTNSANVYVIGRSKAVYQSSIVRGRQHLQNWAYACKTAATDCVTDDNAGISASWMASHVDWNEVSFNDTSISPGLAANGAKHIVVYSDPNIAPFCPLQSTGAVDYSEDGKNCGGHVSLYLHPDAHGSYAHAYEHQINGNRLVQRNDTDRNVAVYEGGVSEPFYIGDPDLQSAFHTHTSQNPYATDVFEDDAGGTYNCIADDNAQCTATTTFGPPSYLPPFCDYPGGYWCYLYGETAIEWDRAQQPQQAYLNDAIALANHAAHPVIGNNGVATDSYELQWAQSPNVAGVMREGAWEDSRFLSRWIETASHILQYHQLHKLVVEYTPGNAASPLYFQIASHWIVYDPTYSVEALGKQNLASQRVGTQDTTWPEQTIVPSEPLVAAPANNDVRAFQPSTQGVFVREYRMCFQSGAPVGPCAAVVNANDTPGNAVSIPALTQSYGHVLVPNTSATWAAGGTVQWSTSVPSTIAAGNGVLLAQ